MNKSKAVCCAVSLLVTVAASHTGGAEAQTPQPPATAPDAETLGNATDPRSKQKDDPQQQPDDPEQIVVTAEKRGERQLTTPVSISVVTSSDIKRLAATEFQDFASTIPGLNYSSTGVGQKDINIRGVTTGTDITPTVGIYVDDVPYGSSSAFAAGAQLGLDAGLFDISRIEVLRGPQGTLYGAGAEGGLIKYVTNPVDTGAVSGSVSSGVSTTQGGGVGFNGDTVVNVPLVKDVLAVRISDYYTRDAGYIDNTGLKRQGVNQGNLFGARGEIVYTPNTAFDMKFTAFGQNVDRDGTAQVDRNVITQRPTSGDLDQNRVLPEPFGERFRLYAGTVNYRTPFVDMTSISSYQDIKTSVFEDYSGLYVPLLNQLGLHAGAASASADRETQKFTQEVRLASPGHHALEWLLGGFFTHEYSQNSQQLLAYDKPLGPPTLNLGNISVPSVYNEYAAFGDLTYHVTTKLEVTAGLRYSNNEQRFAQNSNGLLINGNTNGGSHDNTITYLANVRYLLTPDMIAYTRFASGYNPGGPNFVARNPATGALLAPPTFKAETLYSYEVGFKSSLLHNLLTIDTDLYYIHWKNIQVVAAADGLAIIANARAANIKGAEGSFVIRPARGFSLTTNVSLNDGQLVGNDPGLGASDGAELPNSPHFTTSETADYSFPLGEASGNIGATLRYTSARVSGFNEQPGLPQYRLHDYTTVGFHGELRYSNYFAQMYVHNALNSRGQLSADTSLSAFDDIARVSLVEPRTIGFNISTSF